MNDENVGSKRYDPVAMLRTLTPCPSPNGRGELNKTHGPLPFANHAV